MTVDLRVARNRHLGTEAALVLAAAEQLGLSTQPDLSEATGLLPTVVRRCCALLEKHGFTMPKGTPVYGTTAECAASQGHDPSDGGASQTGRTRPTRTTAAPSSEASGLNGTVHTEIEGQES